MNKPKEKKTAPIHMEIDKQLKKDYTIQLAIKEKTITGHLVEAIKKFTYGKKEK